MGAFISLITSVVQMVVQLITGLIDFILSLPMYVSLLVQVIGILPFGLGALALVLITVGVIKLIIGRTTG